MLDRWGQVWLRRRQRTRTRSRAARGVDGGARARLRNRIEDGEERLSFAQDAPSVEIEISG
jgi:hypothetical protein